MATSNLRFRIIGEDDASGTFLKVAASAKLLNSTFSDLGQNALGLTKMVGAAGLIPVFAAAAAATVELSTSLAAAAGAGGIFGLSVAGYAKEMIDAQTKIASTQKSLDGLSKGTKEYGDKLKELKGLQSDFTKEFGPAAAGLADMKTAWSGFLQATHDVTTGVMAKGFTLIKSVLPQLVPVSNAAGKAIGGLITELTVWTRSPEFGKILDWFAKSGPKAITAFGHAIGNLVHGLGELLSNFAGPGDKAAKTLEHLTRSFDKWAGSRGVSRSVDGFLKYVSGNGGQISSVFASLAEVLPKLAVALGQLGTLNLNAMSMFLNLIAGMSQTQFNIVVEGMFGIVAAAKALAIISGVNALIEGMQLAMTGLGDACIGTRLGLLGVAVADGVVAVAAGLATAATVALDAALAVLTSPITAVVAAIIGLAAGFIYAYKHSETFRNLVDADLHFIASSAKNLWSAVTAAMTGIGKAMQAVGRVASWLWTHAFAPMIQFILHGVALLLEVWAKMMDALSHVPGSIGDWAGKLAGQLHAAAAQAEGVANSIRNIPTEHVVNIHIVVTKSTNALLADVNRGAGSGSGGGGFDKVLLSPGEKLMRGLVDGIKRGYVPLRTALDKVTAYVQTQRDKLNSLLSARNQFAAGFQSFTSSLFGADFGQDAAGNAVAPTVGGILAYQQQQADQAKRLRHQVRTLVHKGLSPALLKQLQAAGPAGLAEIAALAQGASRAQIRRLNASQHATQSALHGAGMAAGNAIYGQQIVQTRNNEDLAKRIAHRLAQRLHEAGKNERLVITDMNGQWVIKAIKKDKRQRANTGDKTP